MEQYWKHLPTCNKVADWTEAQQAMSDTPEKFRDEDWQFAYHEMQYKMQTCTCGMENALKETKESLFTPDQIRKVQELAYDAGWEARGAGDTISL